MSELQSIRTNIAPSVRALLVVFNEDTRRRLELAPVDSRPIYQSADGSLMPVDEDGWISDSDADLDKADAIMIAPISVVNTETP